MARLLYILSEGERDDLFYERLAERVTAQSFSRAEDNYQNRRGANWKSTMSAARLLMANIKRWQGKQNVAVILAVDNDRAGGHPGAKALQQPLPFDQKKEPRYPALKKIVEDALGPDRNAWPVDVALAVPVEMIESWVLLLLDPQRAELPLFAEASQPLTHRFYGKPPPPQLKDLRDGEANRRSMNLDDLFMHAADQDLFAAEAASPSLKMFTDELRMWRKETA